MSRSYQKSNFHRVSSASSEKEDKQFANRKFRRIVKQKIHSDSDLPLVKETSNVWCFDKDGKVFDGSMTQSDRRK